MKGLWIFWVVWLFSAPLFSQQIRVACIGSNVTYGTGMEKREVNAYPQQLQRLLGDAYLVKNFGSEGTVASQTDPNSFEKSEEYQASLDFKPEIILIEFGMVEAVTLGMTNKMAFESGLKYMVNKYFNLPTAIRVMLISPPEIGSGGGEESKDDLISNIIPSIQQVAYETNSEVIDLFSLLQGNTGYFADDYNLSANGAARMSRNIFETLNMRSEHDFDFLYAMGIEGVQSNFQGYHMSEFELFGWTCKIVKPKRTAIGRPWVWKTQYFEANLELDIQMLQHGYHIMHIETEGLYGNDMALDRLNRFYELIEQGGMAKTAVMLGVDDGAIAMFKWAVANQEKISFIYTENPVMDLKSWPAGEGKGPGNEEAWKELKKVYDIRSSKKMDLWQGGSPLDYAVQWHDSNIPMLVIAKSNHDQIPYDENGGKFFESVLMKREPRIIIHEGDYTMDLTEKSGMILNYTGYKTNFAIVAASGTETRGEIAGWRSGVDWWDHHKEINQRVNTLKPDILFLGDQATQGIGGGRTLLTRSPGEKAFKSVFSEYSWENGGIYGDKTQQLTFRVSDGGYNRAGIRLVVVSVGFNNFEEDSADEISRGIATVVRVIERQMPDSKILVIGPLPVGHNPTDPNRIKYEEIHDKLRKIGWGDFVTYRRILKEFYDSFGKLKDGYYEEDGINLTPAGYQAWADWLKDHTDQIIISSSEN